MKQSLWGAVFDWDGVIVDSAFLHQLSWEIMSEQEKKAFDPDAFVKGFGMTNEVIIPNILGWAADPAEIRRLAREKEETYRRLVREKGLSALPGVEVFLRRLKDAGTPCVVGSSTERANLECAIDVLGFREYLPHMVAGDEVKHGKPEPDIFLKAAAKIGMPPSRCIVFEDAVAGIQAARAAGMKVVAVTTTRKAADLQEADIIVKRLDLLTAESIHALFA
ncbi:MAG: HAD family hydrolase [Kiritimatiellia bacterium]